MNNTYYITTPIYYVNDVPHIGHAYTSVASDVIARFMRLSGHEVMFLTGTDEHGQKVEKAAIDKNIDPQKFTDQTSQSFRHLMTAMHISNDDFIRTTEERHKKAVAIFWQKLLDNGSIYEGFYEGWYAVRDEAFYDESELTADKLAPTGAAVEWVKEPSYFFNLSKWQDKLLEFYEANPDFIRPISRRNEVISFVKSGLKDLSVSRTTFNWGIKVPNDNKHVIYVWLDALANYISALGYPDQNSNYGKFWPANLQVVGKDILRFHAVYWPAFLMAAEIPLPKTIMAHGWWTNEGQKISKSLGNTIDPIKLIEEFGVDQVRYFLMREITFGADGNFARSNLITRINSELSNKIGNLLQRTTSFVYKNNDGKVPAITQDAINKIYELPLLKTAINSAKQNILLMEKTEINKILDNIINLAEEANIYIDSEAPWNLKKTDPEKMLEVLYALLETLRYIAVMLQAFMPSSAGKMLDQLGVNTEERLFKHLSLEFALTSASDILEPVIVFPRFEE
ncbi:methionine--tRNA ligase [Rickettsia bellii]|uniref:Methionine--tRNA ligase n=3 Tax=Rickettsia bellii TaxID=33990 RepID=SYM_RICBR|nr:methionine--tRNA ligase [Rickettsia bellii]Q1RJZ5.1 RecName: Full=Methionine--tRNA ligase; AltName: Full=Methionyl-tRNA synthetase; Short=MetRS [Rickettsia bellii RML369-C]ABE04319.1 Methionyl-tRNA synthetase [Rickettsia bellii RML369-C]ARD86238.1 methionine--tRNA ligase [Rickettsia bellii]KJV90237.1 methionine--tRNA ligase [Rickettsia bellii str. RML An4]KJV92340.1 methionine--tRNA ligase [Rickettsia bellii str. RML Mogi]